MGMTAAIAVSALGAGVQAQAYNASGKSQQALSNYNAEIGMIKSTDALARGAEAEKMHRANTRRIIGSQRAAFAASGVDVNDPDSTAVNVNADTAALSEMDAINIRTNAAREAWGYRVGATDDRARGEIAMTEANNKAIGSMLSVGGSVLYNKYGFGATTRGRA